MPRPLMDGEEDNPLEDWLNRFGGGGNSGGSSGSSGNSGGSSGSGGNTGGSSGSSGSGGGGGTLVNPPPNSTVYAQGNRNSGQQSAGSHELAEQEADFNPFLNSGWWNSFWSDPFYSPSGYGQLNGYMGYGPYLPVTQNSTVYSPGFDTSPTILAEGVPAVPSGGSVWSQSPSQGSYQIPTLEEIQAMSSNNPYGIASPFDWRVYSEDYALPSEVYEHPPNNTYQQWLDWENGLNPDTPLFLLDAEGQPTARYVWDGDQVHIMPLADEGIIDSLLDTLEKAQAEQAAVEKVQSTSEFIDSLPFLDENALNHFIGTSGFQEWQQDWQHENPLHPLITQTSPLVPEVDFPFYDQNRLDYFTNTNSYQTWLEEWQAENPLPISQPAYNPANSVFQIGPSSSSSEIQGSANNYSQQNNHIIDMALEPPTSPTQTGTGTETDEEDLSLQLLRTRWMTYPQVSRSRGGGSTQKTADWVANMINWKL